MKKTYKGAMKISAVVAALVALTFGAQTAFAQSAGFEFHAYARSGFAFAPGLYTTGGQIDEYGVGRLGNELNQSYLESELVHTNTNADGSWAKYHVMFVVNSNGNIKDFKSYPGSYGNGGVGDILMRQAYVEMGGFNWDPKAVYWIGEKYNGRDDIHILDFFWRDMSGEGVGISNAFNGFVDLSEIAAGNGNTYTIAGENYIPFTTDLRLHLGAVLPALSGVELEGAVTYAPVSNNGGDQSGNHILPGNNTSNYGFQGAIVYSPDKFFWFADGYSRIAVQYGAGDSASAWYLGTANAEVGNAVGATAFRALIFGEATNVLPNLDIMPSLYYEMVNSAITAAEGGKNQAGQAADEDVASKLSFVIRPVYKLNQNISVQLEAGVDHVSGTNSNTFFYANGAGFAGITNYKVTLAPTLSLDSGFWGRPQLRLFWSLVGTSGTTTQYGTWGQSSVVGNVDANNSSTSENRFGVQFETWF